MTDVKLGVFTLPRADMTVPEALDYTHSLGLRAFEPLLSTETACPGDAEVARWRDLAAQRGIIFPNLSVEANLCAADGDAEVEKLKALADVARALGSPLFHHTLYPVLTSAARREDFSEKLALAIPRMRAVWDYCEAIGLTCLYEFQGFQFNGRARFAEMMRRLERPAQIVLDVGNSAFVGETPLSQLDDYAGRIRHAHLKDFRFDIGTDPQEKLCLPDGRVLRRVLLGAGDMGIAEILRRLRAAKYDGWFMLECAEIVDAYAEEEANMRWFVEQAQGVIA